MQWTPHNVDTLVAHRTAGLSASMIAEKMGTTRNAIIGKLDRIGMSGRVARKHVPKFTKKPCKPQKRVPVQKLIVPDEVMDLPPDESPHAVSLFDVGKHQCRWPVNPKDGQFMFCGDAAVDGHSWCARHCLRGFAL